MTDVKHSAITGGIYPVKWIDNGDSTYSMSIALTATNVAHTIIDSVPAAARTTDSISSADATDRIMNNLTALTPARAFANVAASQTGSTALGLSASGSLIYRVLALAMVTGGTSTTVVFNTTTGPTTITATFANGANGGVVLPYNPLGWFQNTAGDGLTVTTGAGSTTGIQVVYVTAASF